MKKWLLESARYEALKLQTLLLNNPWVEDLDVTITTDDGNIMVNLNHEFMKQSFNASDQFYLRTPTDDEAYARNGKAQTAYDNIFPILIGMDAGFVIQEKISSSDFTLGVDDDDKATLKVVNNDDEHLFVWNVEKQGFEPIDEDRLPKDHGFLFKSIRDIVSYVKE